MHSNLSAALRRGTRQRPAAQPTLDAKGQRPPQERTLTVASPENRACLEYHIHRCSGPCIDAVSQRDYMKMIDQAALFLQGKSAQVLIPTEALNGRGCGTTGI